MKIVTLTTPQGNQKAWHLVPEHAARAPGILMLNGFGIRCEAGPLRWAETLAKAGYSVLCFDFEGEAACLHFDPAQYRELAEHALHTLTQMPQTHPDTCFVWGMSLGAGIALEIAADATPTLQGCILSQPFCDGRENFKHALGEKKLAALVSQTKGHPIRLVTAHNRGGLFQGEAALDVYQHQHDHTVSFESVHAFLNYAPIERAPQVHCPTLVQITSDDEVNVPALQYKLYDTLYCPKAYRGYTGGHFAGLRMACDITQPTPPFLKDIIRWCGQYSVSGRDCE